MPRVIVLQGQVGHNLVLSFCSLSAAMLLTFRTQAQRVLGVNFFGCSHLKQTAASGGGDNLYSFLHIMLENPH